MRYKYIIDGKKWHDKVNGNTYHCVNITVSDSKKLIFSSGLTYCNGDQWQHTALIALIKLGLWKAEDRFNHELKRELLYFTCNDNALKRDLKKKEVL